MEKIGYKVIASTGVGQTIIWTLYKPDGDAQNGETASDK